MAATESERNGRLRWPAADYAATRLTNFRIPVDLHDRYRRLVHEAELRHPQVRRPSLTEVVIALLEEGPSTPDEVAELIRRKRAAVKQAIARTVTELEARVAKRAAEKQAQRHANAELPADPGAEARREEQRAIREVAETAHGVNLDVGAGLLTGLSAVDPADMAVARFFVLCGRPHRTNYADSVAMRIAAPARLEVGALPANQRCEGMSACGCDGERGSSVF